MSQLPLAAAQPTKPSAERTPLPVPSSWTYSMHPPARPPIRPLDRLPARWSACSAVRSYAGSLPGLFGRSPVRRLAARPVRRLVLPLARNAFVRLAVSLFGRSFVRSSASSLAAPLARPVARPLSRPDRHVASPRLPRRESFLSSLYDSCFRSPRCELCPVLSPVPVPALVLLSRFIPPFHRSVKRTLKKALYAPLRICAAQKEEAYRGEPEFCSTHEIC